VTAGDGVASIPEDPLQLKTPLILVRISGTAHGRLPGEIDSLRLFHRSLSLEERLSNAYGSVWSEEVTLTIHTEDSDEEGLTDYEEALLKTDPRKPDYYGDRMPPMASLESNSWETILAESRADSRSRRAWVSFALQILLRTPRLWWIDE
jgi:hypothetical protein